MQLGEAQELFAECLAKLLVFIYENGDAVRLGDVFARDTDIGLNGIRTHKKNSQHYKKLAVDINLFKDGNHLKKTEDHRLYGMFWEGLHPLCRWGGRYGDGNHYEVMENGWR